MKLSIYLGKGAVGQGPSRPTRHAGTASKWHLDKHQPGYGDLERATYHTSTIPRKIANRIGIGTPCPITLLPHLALSQSPIQLPDYPITQRPDSSVSPPSTVSG